MLTGPGADLRGIPQQLVGVEIPLQHELAQALPGATRHILMAAQLKQVDRLAIEMANAMLAQHFQVLALEPLTREQRTIAIDEKALAATGNRPTTADGRIQYRG
ncbi:hypothetical protein D3C75_1094570 [compost metagenome]